MDVIYSIADWFEGLLRLCAYGGLIAAGIMLLGVSKSDERLKGLKFIAGGLLAFGALALAGAVFRQLGNWTSMPERFMTARWMGDFYYSMRQLASGAIDLGAFGAIAYGALTVKKAFTSTTPN